MSAEAPIKPEDLFLQQDNYYYEPVTPDRWISDLRATLSKLHPRIAWEQNSGMMQNSTSENSFIAKNSFNNNRQFIKLYQAFLKQLEIHKDVFSEQNSYIMKEKMKISSDELLKISPDKISLEITSEGSIFYKILKDDISIFLEHFLIEEFDDTDEAIITIYQNDDNILNFGGYLTEVINELNKLFVPQSLIIAD